MTRVQNDVLFVAYVKPCPDQIFPGPSVAVLLPFCVPHVPGSPASLTDLYPATATGV
jgi:hypothetical protein